MRAEQRKIEPTFASPATTVATLVRTRFVRLPAWFTLGQALRVADLRGVDHVLVEEQGRVRGTVSRAVLAAQKPGDPLARWLKRDDSSVTLDTDVAVAASVMTARGLTCLPVASNGLLVGTVSLTDLRHPAGASAAEAA
jgi:CBS domain-containing protein